MGNCVGILMHGRLGGWTGESEEDGCSFGCPTAFILVGVGEKLISGFCVCVCGCHYAFGQRFQHVDEDDDSCKYSCN